MVKDINNKEITAGMVVEISGAYSKSDNGLWYVDHLWCGESYYSAYDGNKALWLHKLNKDMSKAKGKYSSKSWPLRSHANDPWKRREINSYNEANAKIEMLCPYVEPEKKQVSNEIRILKRGIRKGEKYYPCFYWLNSDNSITVYAREYGYDGLPDEIGNVINETNGQIDYFEKSHCFLREGDRYYNEVKAKIVTRDRIRL